MRILALETSGTGGSAATLEVGGAAHVVRLPPSERSAPGLAPAIRDVLAAAGWQPRDVDVVGITVGPGSFTGLRIGVTTAKTLAFALGADLIGVNTLEVIARQVSVDAQRLWTVLDAHRSQLFVGRFESQAEPASTWRAVEGPPLMSVDEWIAELKPVDCVAGPVVGRLRDRIAGDVRIAPESTWQPDAATVALITAELYAAGRRDDLWAMVPRYGRLAAAEEKLAANSSSLPSKPRSP